MKKVGIRRNCLPTTLFANLKYPNLRDIKDIGELR